MASELQHGNGQIQTGPEDQQAAASSLSHKESSEALGQADAAIMVSRPAAGETLVVATPAADESFLLNFDPAAAQVQIEGDNLVLGFDDNGDGTLDSRIVFENLAQADVAPVALQIGGTEIASDILIGQALDLAGQTDAPLGTVAAGPGTVGGGGSSYSDDLGSVLDLLAAQGIIPPVELQFGLIELDDEIAVLKQAGEVGGEAAREPSVGLQVRGDSGAKEDNQADIDISAATTSDGDTLTQVMITAPADWVLNATAGGDIASVAGNGSNALTLTLAGGVTNFSGAIKATAPADTDVDAVFTVAATAVDGPDSANGSNDFPVVVDAVLDEALELGTDGSTGGSEQAAAQTLGLGLDATLKSAGFGLSLAGGADTDGSESTTLTLTLDDPLPAGAVLSSTAAGASITNDSGGSYTISGPNLEAAVDGLQVEVSGGFEGVISGTISTESREANTPEGAAGGSGQEPDTSDNVSTDSVSFAVTVEGGQVSPEAAIGLPTGVAAIKEDSENNVVEFSASAGDATDELTTVVIELPDVTPGDVDITQVNTDLGANGSATVTTPGGVTTIEITFNDAADIQNFSSSFTLDAPDEDSDVDLTNVKITAQAKDITEAGSTGLDDATTTIVVDAVLDEAGTATQGTAPTVSESGAAQEIDLDLSLGVVSAGFGLSGAGGEDTDGSEEVAAVTVTISDGVLELGGSAPAGSTLTDNGGGSYTVNVASASDYGAAIAALEVEVPGGFDGAISGWISVTTAEVSPSGGEPDGLDNSRTVVNCFTASVETGQVTPTASLALGGAAAAIKEDSTDNLVEFTATAGDSTDELTTVVIKLPGVLAGDVDALDFGPEASKVDGTSIQEVGGDVEITITLNPGHETLTGSFTLDAPVADSDVDLTGVTITANARDMTDSSETGSDGQTTDIVVDAVLDEVLDLGTDGSTGSSEQAGAQTIGLGLNATLGSAGFGLSLAGGADGDGSESSTVTLTLNALLPAGASLSSTAGTVTPTGNPLVYTITGPDLAAAVDGLQVEVPGGFEGTISGTVSTESREANTPEGAAAGSGLEPDTADNVSTDSVTFTVTVEGGGVIPTASLALAGGADCIDEDSVNNVVGFTANSGDSTDELTTVVIELPNVTPGDVDIAQINTDLGENGSAAVTTPGGVTTIEITFNDAADVQNFSSSFTLDAPDEDSDVDLTGVTITAKAQDKTDNSEVGSDSQTTHIHVDAVADGGAFVGTVGHGVSTNGSVVDLDLTLTPRGHTSGSPDDENDGGFDTDGSEAVTAIQVTLSGTPAISDESDADLDYDAGFGGVVDHATNTLVWTFTGTEAQLTSLVQSLQVDPADDYEGMVSVEVSVTTTEEATEAGNPDAGNTNGAHGVECDDSDNAVTESFEFKVETEVVESLAGKIVINEVGLGVSEEQNDGGFHVEAGLNFIEIRNIANNAAGVNGKAIERLDVEVVGPGGTKVTIDLSTLSGATGQHGLAAKEHLVLYENGTWAIYDSGGALKNSNSHGSYTSNSPWGFGETTSDELAINMVQEISAGNFIHVDGLLANDAETGSLSSTANQIWEGAGSGSAAAADLFGGFVDAAQFNGMIGDQWAVLGSILAPGQSVLDDPESLNGAVNDGLDDATRVFARVYSENVPGQSHVPGDTVNGGTPDMDTNQELDWTTGNQSTQGGVNQAPGDLNPQDESDDFDPAQGGGSNDEIAGQTVIDVSEGGESDTANEAEDNALEGGRGQDLLFGDSDDNLLHGGDHNDLLFGDQGDDRLEGEKGADLLTDVDGEDLLVGGAGDDILIGGEQRLEGDAPVSGDDGGDLLVGDNIIEGQVPTFNVVYVIDRSGSMGNEFDGTSPGSGDLTRLDHAKQAFLTINQQIIDAGFAGVVNIKVVPFSSWATDSSDLEFDRADDAGLADEINGLTSGGGTQYEAPLNVAADWLLEGGRHAGSQNFIFFLSDGGDNNGLGGFNPYEIPGLVADLYGIGSDSPNISNLTIEAFGFGDSGASDFLPDELDQVERYPEEGPNTGTDVSDADYATIVENPDDIEQIFSAISLTDENLGEDVILAGSHSDYIFGDTLVVDPDFVGSERDFCAQVLFEDAEGMALRLPLDTIGLSDWIEGGAGNDSVMGQGGDDTLIGQDGDDLIYGGDGDDLLRHTLTEETLGATGNHYDGGRDSDTLQLHLTGDQAANDAIAQAVQDLGDFIAVNSDPGSISGNGALGTFADLGLEIRNFEALEVCVDGVAVPPQAGCMLIGSDVDDVLDGNSGADWLYARGGDDTVTGGSGADTFVFVDDGAFQIDTITDFDTGEGDVIDLSGLLSDVPSGPDGADLDDYLSFVSDGGNTTISVDSDGTGGSDDFQIVVEGVDLNAGNTIVHEDVLNTLLTNDNLVAE